MDIETIIIDKTDEFSYDTIRLVLKKSDETEFHVSKDVDGWLVFMEKLEENLSGTDKEWFLKVMFPAFEACETRVYKKSEILGNQQ